MTNETINGAVNAIKIAADEIIDELDKSNEFHLTLGNLMKLLGYAKPVDIYIESTKNKNGEKLYFKVEGYSNVISHFEKYMNFSVIRIGTDEKYSERISIYIQGEFDIIRIDSSNNKENK